MLLLLLLLLLFPFVTARALVVPFFCGAVKVPIHRHVLGLSLHHDVLCFGFLSTWLLSRPRAFCVLLRGTSHFLKLVCMRATNNLGPLFIGFSNKQPHTDNDSNVYGALTG